MKKDSDAGDGSGRSGAGDGLSLGVACVTKRSRGVLRQRLFLATPLNPMPGWLLWPVLSTRRAENPPFPMLMGVSLTLGLPPSPPVNADFLAFALDCVHRPPCE